MERHAVLAKTPKGQDEIKSRSHGLARKLRAILILVDGTATAGDILAKSAGVPDVEAALESLVSQGFVEIRGANATAAAAPAAPAGALTSPDTTQPLPKRAPPLGATQPIRSPAAPAESRAEAMAALKRFVVDNLGAAADALTGALEQARTPADFHAAAERCAHALAAADGASTAQAFRDRARAYLDAHLGGG